MSASSKHLPVSNQPVIEAGIKQAEDGWDLIVEVGLDTERKYRIAGLGSDKCDFRLRRFEASRPDGTWDVLVDFDDPK